MHSPDKGSGYGEYRRSIIRLATAVMLAAGITISAQAAEPSDDGRRVIYEVRGAFGDVLANVSDAILEKGLVISSVSHVGEMLDRTRKDLGGGDPIYHKAEVLEFCSAVISRRALAADPHSIVYCPYKIAIYALPEAPEQIYLAFPRLVSAPDPETSAALGAIEELLRDIVERALE